MSSFSGSDNDLDYDELYEKYRKALARIDELERWQYSHLPEDEEIEAAFPTRSGRHDLYQEAMRLVGARITKGELVALVNWLLVRIDDLETR